VVHTGHAGPSGHYGGSLGQSGHFGGSHAKVKESFENSQKSVFCRTLEPHMDMAMKECFARVAQMCTWLYDLRAIMQNRRHFGSTMLGDKRYK
jgi:hypothetical protein